MAPYHDAESRMWRKPFKDSTGILVSRLPNEVATHKAEPFNVV